MYDGPGHNSFLRICRSCPRTSRVGKKESEKGVWTLKLATSSACTGGQSRTTCVPLKGQRCSTSSSSSQIHSVDSAVMPNVN